MILNKGIQLTQAKIMFQIDQHPSQLIDSESGSDTGSQSDSQIELTLDRSSSVDLHNPSSVIIAHQEHPSNQQHSTTLQSTTNLMYTLGTKS